MDLHSVFPGAHVERPRWVSAAVAIELLTCVTAIPVGWMFITDPSGAALGLPRGWIEDTVFGSYFVPGLYLLLMNGFGMLGLAALTVMRDWTAPWLTGVLGGGLVIWILVQLAIMPETMVLQWIFLAAGIALSAISLAWLIRTRQLRVA